jgi:putative transposase
MPYVKIWFHLIFSTKNRAKLIFKDVREKLAFHIYENAKQKGIYVDRVNGGEDHLHVLLSLNNEMSISKAAQLIKGESSY